MAWPLRSLMPKEHRFADTFFDAQRTKVEADTFFDAKESIQRKAPRIARKPEANSTL